MLRHGNTSNAAIRLVFTSDGSRSRREPYALVKTTQHKQKQKKKEMFPFSSASASVASENQPLSCLLYVPCIDFAVLQSYLCLGKALTN